MSRWFLLVLCAAAALVVEGEVAMSGGMGGSSKQGEKDSSRDWAALRSKMVDQQISSRGVQDPKVLAAMRKVPRHLFVPVEHRDAAYQDSPLPIGERQTISQPYIVALMTELLQVSAGEKVLEIGTGSGYQAAVLAEMGVKVFSMEIKPTLCQRAQASLLSAGYNGVTVRCADGYQGWPEEAPFDGIIVTAAPEHVPKPLLEQLKQQGRMVIPVGAFYQELTVITRVGDEFRQDSVIPVRFVPMTGEIEHQQH